ncbi:MAG: hypothetical protein JRI80_16935 [Deltaproteobacteria bacterium]|nr:hypothetical protein [Deltaproteobacteria bacterium]
MIEIRTEEGIRWYPAPINKLESFLQKAIFRGTGFVHVYALRKNLAYNLQYIEYLDKSLSEIKLSSVITTQTYKMFIIVGCGIIESLLTYFLIKSGNYSTKIWQLEAKMPGQEKLIDGKKKRIDCYILKKLSTPVREEMTFDSMLRKAEKKKVLGPNHDVYSKLNYLRKLRNKVHLQTIDEPTDTDWNAFKYRHLCAMAQVVYSVFTSNIFHPSAEDKILFSYLEKYNAQQLDPPDSL